MWPPAGRALNPRSFGWGGAETPDERSQLLTTAKTPPNSNAARGALRKRSRAIDRVSSACIGAFSVDRRRDDGDVLGSTTRSTGRVPITQCRALRAPDRRNLMAGR